jgi:hypothetical protein
LVDITYIKYQVIMMQENLVLVGMSDYYVEKRIKNKNDSYYEN